MANVTLRVDDDTWAAVKAAAEREGVSANAYIATILTAVTDPQSAGDGVERIRERLRRAGLLEEAPRLAGRRPGAAAVRAAGRRAGRGTPVSDLIVEGRG
jgi:hypothetical protein